VNRPYATTAELAAYLQVADASLPTGAAMILDMASRLIEAAGPRLTEAGITDAVAPEIKALCLRVAARTMHNPSGLSREVIGSYSYEVSEGAGPALTEDEYLSLSRFRDAPASVPVSPWREMEWAADAETF
jgi:hypothetical protein